MRFLSFKFGRGGEIRTHGLMVPNHARYHLRYTPMQLFHYNDNAHGCQVSILIFTEKYAKFVDSCFRKKCVVAVHQQRI